MTDEQKVYIRGVAGRGDEVIKTLTFVGFGPNGNMAIEEATVCCLKITEDVVDEARKWACKMIRKDGVNVESMCLINSVELEGVSKSQKGGAK